MRLVERQQQLDACLPLFRELWHPQPFCELRPAWCQRWPALAEALLALEDAELARLDMDNVNALAWLASYLPDLEVLAPLSSLPRLPQSELAAQRASWARDIPGRKRQQIEAFAAAATPCGEPVIDWCGGKGHLGRLLALQWQARVQTLEIDPVLCAEGELLAGHQRVDQHFVVADALADGPWPQAGQHAVALHACGDLHRRLIAQGINRNLCRFDVAPCCYHRGVAKSYQALSGNLQLKLSRDDTRLAVTETVTASPRLARKRDREMAWKLGFDAYRRSLSAEVYKTFKPVPAVWFAAGFAEFLQQMAQREGLPAPRAGTAETFEKQGWQRQREVMRLSVVRHAFRRAIETWLALDLAVFLENSGYRVSLGCFCERQLTPRNLLISAQRDE